MKNIGANGFLLYDSIITSGKLYKRKKLIGYTYYTDSKQSVITNEKIINLNVQRLMMKSTRIKEVTYIYACIMLLLLFLTTYILQSYCRRN